MSIALPAKWLGVAAVALASMAWVPDVFAQAYPTRPITLIIPYAAGGIADVMHRIIAEGVSKRLGQPIVIDNRTGGGGQIGANAIVRAQPDGYTLGVFNSTIAVNLPLSFQSFKMEVGKNYAPIARTGDVNMILVTGADAPFRDVQGMLDFAKANPKKLTFASSGIGTTGHLTFELLKYTTGIDAVHVPYKGEVPAMTDIMGGQVLAGFVAYPSQLIAGGKLRALAISSAQRWDAHPELLTLQEQGVKVVSGAWLGIVGPAGLPADILKKLNEAIVATLKDPQVARKLADLQLVVTESTPEQFSAFILEDIARWRPVFKEANINLN